MEFLNKIVLLLLAGPLIFIFAKPIKNIKWFRHIFIALHAVFLTYCTVFLFNRPEWRWGEQESFVSNKEKKAAYDFIRNNFLLIDNSFDKMLLPNPEGDESDSTSLVLTNRKSLASFLRLLNENVNKVDLVVIDMGFHDQSPDDTVLKPELLQLYSDNKLLLSLNPNDEHSIKMVEDQSVYGNISEKGRESLFTSHTIYKDGYYSLPYKIYSLVHQKKAGPLFFRKDLFREKTVNGKTSLHLNTFFPEFRMTNEKILRGEERPTGKDVYPGMDEGKEISSRTYYFLSQPLSPEGKEDFVRNLEQRKTNGQRNIVFIGAFASSDEDIHQTLHGDLHGTTIILNVLCSLEKKDHAVRLIYVFFLLLGYYILSMILFCKELGIPYIYSAFKTWYQEKFKRKPAKRKQETKKPATETQSLLVWFKNLVHFILDFVFVKELVITCLLLFALFVQFLFGQWPNILPLLIYIAALKVSLQYAAKHIISH